MGEFDSLRDLIPAMGDAVEEKDLGRLRVLVASLSNTRTMMDGGCALMWRKLGELEGEMVTAGLGVEWRFLREMTLHMDERIGDFDQPLRPATYRSPLL